MSKSILYIDLPAFKALPPRYVLDVVGFDWQALVAKDEAEAIKIVNETNGIAALVTNAPLLTLIEAYRHQHKAGQVILLTDMTMDLYAPSLAFREHELLDHVIANTAETEWMVAELRTTLQKMIRNDIFGIQKYLKPQTPIQSRTVIDSASRESLNSEVMKLAEAYKLGTPVAKLAYGISEELLMNAIYDAPLAGSSKEAREEMPRSTVIFLAAHEYSTLEYGCDGLTFAISVRDPFGALTREKFFSYIKKVLRRSEGAEIMDKKKAGAGLGLYKILYSSSALICNSTPDQQTEVIALMNLKSPPVRDFAKSPRSIHFFAEG